MKNIMFKTKAVSFAFVVAVMAFAACTKDATGGEDVIAPEDSVENAQSTLTTVKLASFAGDASRVTYAESSRAEAKPGSLKLVAEIANPSAQADFSNFDIEDRYLSATSVYYDQSSGTYYATYHMQGNNYNTKQEVETAGLIETFNINEDGEPTLKSIYRAENPSELDFDFNHIYFDQIPNPSVYVGDYTADSDSGVRIIVGGHKTEPSSKVGGKPNTAAIIAKLNLPEGTIDYATVYTGEKILDDNDKSLGNEDAGDVNCFVRKYNHYYLATRKGIAILKAGKENMFEPELDANDHVYFLKTPGSAKYISQPTTTSYIDFLYLTEDTPKDMTATTAIPAQIMSCAISNDFQGTQRDLPIGMESVTDFNWQSGSPWPKISEPIESVSPVDGKNVFFSGSLNTAAKFACLGKNGLYVYNPTYGYNQDEIIKFSDAADGSRPVNGIFVEDWDAENGHHYTDGFIYVANGACLTILDALTLEKVAEYSAYNSKDEEHLASANYVHVVKTNIKTNAGAPDRIITVAYGQAGVKVFKFVPPTK